MKKVEVNEQKIDLLLDMMRGAEVSDGSQAESETMLEMEGETLAHVQPAVCRNEVGQYHI